jgi:glucokinase
MAKPNSIGVDIGGTNLRVALVSPEGRILGKTQQSSSVSLIDTLYGAIDRFAERNVSSIGIASAGLIDRERCVVNVSPNIPSVEGLDFMNLLGKYNLPIFLENDANLAAFGELRAGSGRNYSSFVLLTLGTGVGGGIVYDGKLMNIPAELGHVVVEPDGAQCSCGNHGCLEEYAAAKAMINMATSALEKGEQSSLRECCEGNIYRITPQKIYETAMEGDGLARDILRKAGKYLGIALSDFANIFNPEAFILTGGLTNAWDIYVEEAVKEAEKRAMRGLFKKDSVIRSTIKEDAGLIGAALYAQESSS